MKRYTLYMLMAAFVLSLSALYAYAATPVECSDDDYYNEVVNSDRPVLLQFYANWCGACRKCEPDVKALAAEMGDRLKVVRMNVDKCPKTTSKYKVRSIPAFFYIEDGVEKGSAVGAYSKDELKEKLGIE